MALHSEDDETIAMGAVPPPPTKAVPASQRFAPGTLLASRYRIVSRLGKGGMGEVFRADDIMLGQPVALKFLPENASRNINLLTRFYDEVRIAHQISHANVCRVYDIGEIDGQPYLSMEYIDGEDLSSLLRRIGRLPGDKAAEFARKMCAGLAAAHAQGVLHRDIKPGNIMIDGRGEPRITDFGLAAVAASIEGNEIRNGTPAYMAPEQLEGREVSVQSDLYALGLVFHEMFTGKAPHEAETVAELTAKRKESRASKASTLVGDLDPAVDRAIQACLEPDPKLRPKSALDLARMLPGGDPLAAALAAGQTPSPELVAASGSTGALSPKVGLAVFGATIFVLLVTALAQPYFARESRLQLRNSPDVLTAKARDIVRAAGYTELSIDSAIGFTSNNAVIDYVSKRLPDSDQWDDILSKSPSYVNFWYRASPLSLRPYGEGDGVVDLESPEMRVPGMTAVTLGLEGELLRFAAVPPQFQENPAPGSPMDWSPFFAMAQLDQSRFQAVQPQWVPLAATETRAAWTGVLRAAFRTPIDIPIRIEAAAFAGRPVLFRVIWPWEQPQTARAQPLPRGRRIANLFLLVLILAIVFAVVFLARHHLQAGKGDVRGALHVGLYVGVLAFASRLLGTHFGDVDFEFNVVAEFAAWSMFDGVVYWICYLALEPWVRKFWPQVLITLSRALQGNWNDPLVGRDALFGIGLGVLLNLAANTGAVYSINTPIPRSNFAIQNLLGTNVILSSLIGNLSGGIRYIIYFLLVLFLLRLILRNQWLAAVVFVLAAAFLQAQNSRAPLPVALAFTAFVIFGPLVIVMLRMGVVASMLMTFVGNAIPALVFTADYSAWYGKSSWIPLATFAGIAFWGYRVSVAGKPLLDDGKS